VSGTIQDQELQFDQNRFGDYGTRAAGTCGSDDRRNEMNEKHS
jgi:hypothetical protein